MRVRTRMEYGTAKEAKRSLLSDYQRGVREFDVPCYGSRVELRILQEHRIGHKPHLVMIFTDFPGVLVGSEGWTIRVYPNGSMELRIAGTEGLVMKAYKSPNDGFYFRTGLDVLLRKLLAVLAQKPEMRTPTSAAVVVFLSAMPSWLCDFLHDVAVQWFDLMAMDRAVSRKEVSA